MPEATGILAGKSAALDPLAHLVELPLRAVLYPLGFAVEIATNSTKVVDGARESWGRFEPAFATPALRIRLAVSDRGASLPSRPVFRAQEHLMAIVADAENFAVCDHAAGLAWGWLGPPAAAARAWMRHHFLEAMVYTTLTYQHLTAVHAAAVARHGRGALLCGPSGAGKSSLALACARRGWTFVSDDVSYLVRSRGDRQVLGKPHQMRFPPSATNLFPELAQWPSVPDAGGGMLIEVPMADLPGARIATQCPADHIIFLDRIAGAPPRLSPVEPLAAFELLAAEIPMYSPRVREEHEASIDRLVAGGAHRLVYSDLEQAVSALENLIALGV